MEPYYSRGGIVLYHADCREALPQLGRFDAVITDPPYGIKDAALQLDRTPKAGVRRGKNNTWHAESDWDASIDPEWLKLAEAAAPVVAWFGHWRKRTEVEASISMPIRAEIVWAKNCHVGPPCPVAMQDERIWLFSDAGIKTQRFDTTVWSEPIIPTWAHKEHKNEKPLKLMRRLISLLVKEGQRIVDPFAGSGTTLVAAKQLGVEAVGIELSEAHCETAARRLEAEMAQGSLFEKAAS